LDLLYELIDSEEMPLIRQAEGHRVRKPAREISRGFGQLAVDMTGEALTERAQPVIKGQIERPAMDPQQEPPLEEPEVVTAERVVELRPREDHRVWKITIQVVRDRSEDWYTCRTPERLPGDPVGRETWGLTIRLNLDHPFSELFINESEVVLAPIVRIVAGLALAEFTAKEAGTSHAGRVRRHFNELLRYALAREGEHDYEQR